MGAGASKKASPELAELVAAADTDKDGIISVDGAHVRTLEGHTDGVTSVCVTPDGLHVVTGSNDKTACVWLLANGKRVRTLEGHTHNVCSVCMTPDGQRVVTGSDDEMARVCLL